MGNWSSNTREEEESIFGKDGKTPRLYEQTLDPEQLPIVYSSAYNIGFLGMERIHPFDSGKWGKVYQHLVEGGLLAGSKSVVTPQEVTMADLLMTHTQSYLTSLNSSYNVAMVVEVPPVAILPNRLVHRQMLRPFRIHTGGTILAGKLAKERGWAINIGGGFHHCSSDQGGGFCAYADITLSIKFMFQYLEGISKVMIVDFDAHQGNGHERDFLNDDRVFIIDMYNKWIYPNDREAKAAIRKKIELNAHTKDETYLNHIRTKLPQVLDSFKPDMVVYNAGTDVLEGDPLGILDITPKGVAERDRLVFSEVRKRGIPIFMVTSGGYQRNNARVIADSILNLHCEKLISSPAEDPHIAEQLGEAGRGLREREERNGEEEGEGEMETERGDEDGDEGGSEEGTEEERKEERAREEIAEDRAKAEGPMEEEMQVEVVMEKRTEEGGEKEGGEKEGGEKEEGEKKEGEKEEGVKEEGVKEKEAKEKGLKEEAEEEEMMEEGGEANTDPKTED